MCSAFVEPAEIADAKNKTLAAAAMSARHRGWLKRRATAETVSWRPRKRFRVGARKWIAALDNQVRVTTCWRGLVDITPDSSEEWAASNWRRWPFLACAADQGSDGVAGWHAMAFMPGLQMNTFAWWDPAHGACNDMQASFRELGLLPFVLLALCVHNLAHGPERDEGMRFGQMYDGLRCFFENFQPETSDLFKHHAPTMLSELGGNLDVVDSANAMECLWQYLAERSLFMTKGHKVSLVRFMAWVRASRALLQEWTSTLFCCEWLALEHDFVGGSNFGRSSSSRQRSPRRPRRSSGLRARAVLSSTPKC